MMHKAWCNLEEVPYNFSRSSIKFQGHTGWKIDDLNQIWVRLQGRSQLSNPSDLPCLVSCRNLIWMGGWCATCDLLFAFPITIKYKTSQRNDIFNIYIGSFSWDHRSMSQTLHFPDVEFSGKKRASSATIGPNEQSMVVFIRFVYSRADSRFALSQW